MYLYRILLLIIILLLQSCLSHAQQTAIIAFYNLENLFDTLNDPVKNDDEFTLSGAYHYTSSVYQQKLKNIAHVLNSIAVETKSTGAVLIGVAEVENEIVLKDLANHSDLVNRNYRSILLEGNDERGIDVGLIYDKGRFAVLSYRSVIIPLDTGFTRDILYVSGILQKDTFHVLVNHWPSRRDGVMQTQANRNVAARTAKALIDSIKQNNSSAKIILMGDLNDNPEDYSIQNILLCKYEKNNALAGDLYDPWYAIHKTGKGTAVYKHRWDLFDQIIITGNFTSSYTRGWKYLKSEIFDKDFLKQQYGKSRGIPYRSFRGTHWMNGYSDHFPVLLYLAK